ncbi:MAG: tetratricopeptide repeat protein [Candidatus Hodarchaeales archaeon]
MEKKPQLPEKSELESQISKAREFCSTGKLEEAISLLSSLVKDLESLEKPEEYKKYEVDSFAELGKAYWKKGAYNEAKKLLDKAIDLASRISYDLGRVYALNYRGNIELSQGNLGPAEEIYLECLDVRKRETDMPGVAACLMNLGVTYMEAGNLAKAIDHFEEAIALSRNYETLRAKAILALALNNLAGCYRNQGELERAEPLYFESMEISRNIGKQDGIALCLTSLGILSFAMGDLETAKTRLTESQLLWQDLGINNPPYVKNLATLAGVYTELRDFGKAGPLLEKAQQNAEMIKSDLAQLHIDFFAGVLEKKKGNVASARRSFESCLTNAKKLENFEVKLKSLVELALISCFEYRLTLEEQHISRTQEIIQQILQAAIEQGMISVQAEAEIIQGMLYSATMNYDGALRALTKGLELAEERQLPKQTKMAQEQLAKTKRLKERARKLVKPTTQEEQVEEVQRYLNKYQQLLKAFKT